MASYDLYLGGLAGNTDNQILPQNTPTSITGYADHQRRRSYAVNRQIDFRPRSPLGGVDVVVDQKDYCWYRDLLATGVDVEVGDYLNMCVVVPYTRIEFSQARVVIAKAGLVLTLTRRENVGGTPPIADVDCVAAANSPLANALGATVGVFFSSRVDYVPLFHAMMALEVVAVPGLSAAAGGNLGGLFMMTQVEVVDFGSGDFNGNA